MPNPADDAKVYTLADLEAWEQIRPGLPPSLAVLGHPVAHSVSPQMHNAALAELAKAHTQLKDWRYFKFEIDPLELNPSLSIFYAYNFKGLNLTLPHKTNITARFFHNGSSGSVNTLTRMTEGRWDGESTDGYGLSQSVKSDLNVLITGKNVVILGAGGASQATVVECLERNCESLWIGGRKKNEMELNEFFHKFFHEKDAKYFDLSNPPFSEWKTNTIVINATSAGLKSEDTSPIDVNRLPADALIFDMIYRREGGSTALVSAARARGLRTADGLGMLVWQGAKSLTMWIKASEGIIVKPETIAPTMMTAACQALGLPPRTV